MLPLGAHRYVSGKIDVWEGMRQMVHPSRIMDEAGLSDLPAVEPVYGATEGLTSRAINKLAVAALDKLAPLPEWQDRLGSPRTGTPPSPTLCARSIGPTMCRPARRIRSQPAPGTPSRRRLAYDELLASQLALALTRARARRKAAA